MEKVKAFLKTTWDKFYAAVKSAPAVYGYGVATGVLIGWVFL